MNSHFIYRDKEGKPLTVQQWGELFEDYKYRIVKQEHYGDKFISTVWIGIPSLIYTEKGLRFNGYFETAVIAEDHLELEIMRYETLEEAKLGHEAMIHSLKSTNACQ